MRIVIVLASALLSGAAIADTVRHGSVPERFQPCIRFCALASHPVELSRT